MDIDDERLRIAERMAHNVAERLNVHPTIKAYKDRKDALEEADYVINTIQVGGYPSTLIDFEVPKRYGLQQTIGDTLGIGGIFRNCAKWGCRASIWNSSVHMHYS